MNKIAELFTQEWSFCCSFYCDFISFQIRVKSFVTRSILYDVILLANSNLHWVIKWLWLNGAQSWSPHNVFYFRNALSPIGKIFIIDFSQHFIFFTEGCCENVMNDHVLLNISTVTGKWFRKFVFNFNLTGVYTRLIVHMKIRYNAIWQLFLKWFQYENWATAWQNKQNDLCAQRRLRSTWASAQSDQSQRCPPEAKLGPKLPTERTAKTLIRLGGTQYEIV